MLHQPLARIDLAALQHNFAQVRHFAPLSRIIAVLKANAYGHGVLQVAASLPQADAFAVARLHEAITLRKAGETRPIILLEGFFYPDELELVAEYDLQVVVHHQQQVDAICQAKLYTPIQVWLKVDSGMHRLGFRQEVTGVWQQLLHSDNVKRPLRLITHFSSADDMSLGTTKQQLANFQQLTQTLQAESALANSAAIIAWPECHTEWVRPGLMLYGISPMQHGLAEQHNLKPVMTLCSSVIAVREHKKGEPAGYSATWIAEKDTRLAVIAIGYGDGYPRHAVNGTPVLINGKRYPLVGRVAMDMITADIGDDDIAVGDDVVLWGEGLPAEEIAEYAGTIAYELLCKITGRVQFSYQN